MTRLNLLHGLVDNWGFSVTIPTIFAVQVRRMALFLLESRAPNSGRCRCSLLYCNAASACFCVHMALVVLHTACSVESCAVVRLRLRLTQQLCLDVFLADSVHAVRRAADPHGAAHRERGVCAGVVSLVSGTLECCAGVVLLIGSVSPCS